MIDFLNIIPDLSLERIIKHLLGIICHQNKAILFEIGEKFLPLCPRCLGMHSGFFLTLVFLKVYLKKPININVQRNLFLIVFLVGLTGVHWLLGYVGLIGVDSNSRLLTGSIGGSGFYILLNSLKYKYLQSKLTSGTWTKILLACLFILILSVILLGNYNFILVTILLVVTTNIISIIDSLWLIIKRTKNYNQLFEIKKEMQ